MDAVRRKSGLRLPLGELWLPVLFYCMESALGMYFDCFSRSVHTLLRGRGNSNNGNDISNFFCRNL
jgi:hypothetical protein